MHLSPTSKLGYLSFKISHVNCSFEQQMAAHAPCTKAANYVNHEGCSKITCSAAQKFSE